MGLEGKASDSRGQNCSVWVVPSLFCAKRCTGGPQYPDGNRRESKRDGIGARKPDVQLRALRTVSRKNFRTHKPLLVAARRSSEVTQELLVH